MLTFKCKEIIKEDMMDYLAKELVDMMKSTELKTLACDYYDEDLYDKLIGIMNETADGFIFDEKDEIGEEPYGYVSCFFESFLMLMDNLKEKYPLVEIDGYMFVNDLGCAEYVLRQRIHTTSEMDTVEFIDQLQCPVCGKWMDAKDVYEALYDMEGAFRTEEIDGEIYEEVLYASGYSNSGNTATFGLCSAECKEKFEELEEY